MKIQITIILILSISIFNAFSQDDKEEMTKVVEYLASDKLKGRETGTKEERKAAKYLAKEFKKIGLAPKGVTEYFQDFTYRAPERVGFRLPTGRDLHGLSCRGRCSWPGWWVQSLRLCLPENHPGCRPVRRRDRGRNRDGAAPSASTPLGSAVPPGVHLY